MKKELSILIPTFNGDCRQQVNDLRMQASDIDGLKYEIIVADDGSSDRNLVAACCEIAQWPCCHFIECKVNRGRAAIRNFLTSKARFQWLLFLDCDMTIKPDLLVRYLSCPEGDVIDGGVSIGMGRKDNLRYLYEKAREGQHTAAEREKHPYQHFHTANFMARSEIMRRFPFDERYKSYGYEDIFFGKQLAQNRIKIVHIDNPAGFDKFEDNIHFVEKTEEGLRTLHTFRNDLRGYSNLLTFVNGIHLPLVKTIIRCWHRLFGGIERRQLCGKRPSLIIFNLYRMGYYISLTQND